MFKLERKGMNTTKTMRLPPRRLGLIGPPGPKPRPNKRREREGEGVDEEVHQVQLSLTAEASKPPPPSPPQSKQLLAGYLAHEFLTSGTLFGQPWPCDHTDPAEPSLAQPTPKRRAELQIQSYVEVANLMKHSGAHFEGIVNPSQLALQCLPQPHL